MQKYYNRRARRHKFRLEDNPKIIKYGVADQYAISDYSFRIEESSCISLEDVEKAKRK